MLDAPSGEQDLAGGLWADWEPEPARCANPSRACVCLSGELEVGREGLSGVELQEERVAARARGLPVVDVLVRGAVVSQAAASGGGCLEVVGRVADEAGAGCQFVGHAGDGAERGDELAVSVFRLPFYRVGPAGLAGVDGGWAADGCLVAAELIVHLDAGLCRGLDDRSQGVSGRR